MDRFTAGSSNSTDQTGTRDEIRSSRSEVGGPLAGESQTIADAAAFVRHAPVRLCSSCISPTNTARRASRKLQPRFVRHCLGHTGLLVSAGIPLATVQSSELTLSISIPPPVSPSTLPNLLLQVLR